MTFPQDATVRIIRIFSDDKIRKGPCSVNAARKWISEELKDRRCLLRSYSSCKRYGLSSRSVSQDIKMCLTRWAAGAISFLHQNRRMRVHPEATELGD